MTALKIIEAVSIPERELWFHYVCSSGPGGQNVNKVATGVCLRFDFHRSTALPEYCRQRLKHLSDARISKDGVITIKADRHRTREMNRSDALNRLTHLIRSALARRKIRRPTRPTKASREQRLDVKKKRGQTKKKRKNPTGDDF